MGARRDGGACMLGLSCAECRWAGRLRYEDARARMRCAPFTRADPKPCLRTRRRRRGSTRRPSRVTSCAQRGSAAAAPPAAGSTTRAPGQRVAGWTAWEGGRESMDQDRDALISRPTCDLMTRVGHHNNTATTTAHSKFAGERLEQPSEYHRKVRKRYENELRDVAQTGLARQRPCPRRCTR